MNHEILNIVMPVYNEEKSVESVTEEWISYLREMNISFKFLIVNDGSNDGTLKICERLSQKYSEIVLYNQINRGHGQACISGYDFGIDREAQWLLQIDSDGQCDPVYFSRIWSLRNQFEFVFGRRVTRGDGFKRILISKILSVVLFCRLLIWIPDPNVPYRLMRTDLLKDILKDFPRNFNLANILLTIRIQKRFKIKWVPINFRRRLDLNDSKNIMFYIKMGIDLIYSLNGVIK